MTLTYDQRDQLVNQTFSGTGLNPEAVKFAYDNAGNMTGLTRYADLAETTVVASTSYTYDNANQVTGIVDKNSGGTTLVSYGYTYDAAQRVTQETRTWNTGASSDTLTYGYTNNNQLTSVTHTNPSFADETFSWDANGNQTGTGFTTSAGNEQTASPGYTYTYDANGNMVTATQTSTGDVWTYAYDFRNMMTGAVEKNSSGTVIAQASYTYDVLGNRIGMNENGVQTWTLYDDSDPVMDFTSSGSLATRYLNGPAGDLVDTVLARELSNGTAAWYLSDHLGTVRDLINNTGGIIDHVDYSAFGSVLSESSPSNGDRMTGFAGLQRDTVTGLNLAVFRVQNPGTGRWTSQDPLGFAAGDPDLYRYSGGDPENRADPNGTTDWKDSGGRITVSLVPNVDLDNSGWYIIFEAEGGKGKPLETKPLPPRGRLIGEPVDALVIPGKGLLKIDNGTDLYLKGWDFKNNTPLFLSCKRSDTWWGWIPLKTMWYPIGKPNPFRHPVPPGTLPRPVRY